MAPAYAGGALITGDDRRAAVTREVSVVRWDGAREHIVTRLTVAGDAPDAAWLLPVPARASVELGDPALFDQPASATVPSYRTRQHFWPQDGDWPFTSGADRGPGPPPPGPRPAVGVVAGQRLGPFTVTHLSATDPAALTAWLRAGGFALPAGLQDALRPYVALRWQYVAIKLAPASYGALRGALDPLHVTFAAQAPVYPMRLASTPVSLSLYVLAAHRMEPVSAIGGSRPRVTYAGRVRATDGPLSTFARETPYLTAVAQDIATPVTTDPGLRRASSDAPVRQVVYADRLRTFAGVPVWLLVVAAVILAVGGAAIRLAVRGLRVGWGERVGRGSHSEQGYRSVQVSHSAQGDRARAQARPGAGGLRWFLGRGPTSTSSEGSTTVMTGTTEETPMSGLSARVADALGALRARVGGGGAPRAGAVPPMPTEAPTVGVPAESGVSGVPAMPSTGGVPPMPRTGGVPPMPRTAPAVGVDFAVEGAPPGGSPWWPEQAPARGGTSMSYADGMPPLPEEAPATGIPPRPRTAPAGGPDGASWGDVTERTSGAGVPPMPDAAPTVGVPPFPETPMAGGVPPVAGARSTDTVGVPPFPEMPPAGGVQSVAEAGAAGAGRAVFDVPPVPRAAPRVPPMPSAAPYAAPTPPADGGTAHLFASPRALHKYPFCAPPLNQNTYGARHRHRRVQQVPGQGRGTG
ncbi:DUF2330 domain-containing protein [Streptomyces sp. V2]|uniref:DUF2330 domain-containing protein n=1 Tax=Streptomyces niveiscabiei TaxID=164115 RepID=A0ABW9I6B2_9ACTN|nr:DUF2330 domain-containing protein [Streptomyces sp. V2]